MIPSLSTIVLRLAIILPALSGHEFAHAYAADKMGDPTPRMHGRLTLNPLAHIDPIGTIIVPIFVGFGWAKPVPINPYNFRDPGRGSLITSAAGPAANLVQALGFGLILRILVAFFGAATPLPMVIYLHTLTAVNIMLALFNLIPLGPLDGHYILEYYLPMPYKQKYRQFNQYGFMIVLAVIFLAPQALYLLVFNPATLLASMITGL